MAAGSPADHKKGSKAERPMANHENAMLGTTIDGKTKREAVPTFHITVATRKVAHAWRMGAMTR
eukprot:CAMPEP_0117514568 /NCGR_PEP_ID=MMETSP0784-20121206/30136_1 /TAXON_ID=39447 /ORGANISM="" /LENGTH=63 /DNA_ID=CAMNT_0005310367 /DNA_START=83 /DNA_END=270 /DNA_ORIENTATION=-